MDPSRFDFCILHRKKVENFTQNVGHPSVKALELLLKRAKGGKPDEEAAEVLKRIKEDCITCKKIAITRRQFKLTIGTGDLKFNHRVQVDTMFFEGRTVIHMVNEATHFCAASFLRNRSTKGIWSTIQRMWSLVYMGPPDYLVVDQGSAYTSNEMKDSLDAFGVRLDEAPIQTPGAIGTVERYRASLRMAYG